MSKVDTHISKFVFASGGGTSTGSVFAVSGTIGQPDATPVTLQGGGYSLAGGFWQMTAVQTPGLPQLKISLTATNSALLTWPMSSSDFTLEEKSDLNNAIWTPVPSLPANVGSNRVVAVNLSPGHRFYRLSKP